jgi:glycerol kinase
MSDLDAEIEANEEQHHQVQINARQSVDGQRSLLQDEDRRDDNLKDRFIGAIDQGTTSTRFIIFDCTGNPIAKYQAEYQQIHEHSG